MKKFQIRYALLPICVIVIAFIGLKQINFSQSSLFNDYNNNTRWPIKEVYIDSSKTEDEIAIVPHWEDLTISQQFSLVNYNDNNYDSKNTKISSDMISQKLGTATLTGKDTYANKVYNNNAEIYEIKNISKECAIALKFENTVEYYVYINAYYKPDTLQEFIDDLNLKQTLSFGTVYYQYFDTSREENKQYVQVEFPNVEDDIIWNMLFSDTSVNNVHSDNEVHDRIMSISVDIPLLGYKNISVSVSEDGYLMTNILDTGKTFYIGVNKVQEFVNYVIDNCDGHEIVYVIDNKTLNEENITSDEEIIVMQNTTEKNNVIENELITNTYVVNKVEPYIPY